MASRKNRNREPRNSEPGESNEGAESFADWAGQRDEIKPMDTDDRRAPYKPHSVVPPAPNPASEPNSSARHNRWQFPDSDDPLLARQPHVRKNRFADLRAGRIRPTRKIDLHGHRREAAQRLLTTSLEAAAQSNAECVLVIHGKGHRSASGEAVLRQAVPDWLTHPGLLSRVLAFAPAQPRDGGLGAVYVLLR